MDEERILANERLQIDHIRQLDMEELQIEEVDDDIIDSTDEDDDPLSQSHHGDGGAGPYGGFTFDPCLASSHSYLGEVDDTRGRLAFLDGGAILNLPMFYLEGVVLFPEATLPLRVVQSRFKAAVERAMNQVDAPYTIGVIRVYRHPNDERLLVAATGRAAEMLQFATIGTTAEIRQYKRLEDGSLNVVARGQQRFRLRRCWIDVEGAPCAEVQIIQEDTPLRTPKDAFAQLASVSNFHHCSQSIAVSSNATSVKRHRYENEENDWESMSDTSILSNHSTKDTDMYRSAIDSPDGNERLDDSASSDEEFECEWKQRLKKSFRQPHQHKKISMGNSNIEDSAKESPLGISSCKGEVQERKCQVNESKRVQRAPMSFWPQWVYRMYDSYGLAQRAVDMWKQIIGAPKMDDLVRKPDVLSFHIASKLPMSESTRQELLEMDGVSYRLRREIQLLECFDRIRCKNCLTLIAKRSDMVVMSSDGPLNAYVNTHGYVHEVMTIYNASGLVLLGSPVKEHSWFPGYAWTITNCAVCETNMGWLFTATNKNLRPKSFWGIRGSQVADETRSN